jgi:hypothetical protein
LYITTLTHNKIRVYSYERIVTPFQKNHPLYNRIWTHPKDMRSKFLSTLT